MFETGRVIKENRFIKYPLATETRPTCKKSPICPSMSIFVIIKKNHVMKFSSFIIIININSFQFSISKMKTKSSTFDRSMKTNFMGPVGLTYFLQAKNHSFYAIVTFFSKRIKLK